MRRAHLFPFIIAAVAAMNLSQLHAAPLYTAGHGDLGVSYTPGDTTFGTHWGIDAGATVDGVFLSQHTEYAPEDLIAYTTALSNTPSNSATWLGVAGGTSVYRLGSDAYPPNLGFNSAGAGADGNWLDSTLYITLSDWSGPGEVALRSGSSTGSSTIFSTYNIGSTINDNVWEFDMGVGHIHLVWYFSEPGYYELTFDWASTYIGGGAPVDVTGTGTFGFYAGVVPEPGTWSLAILGLGLILVFRRQRQRALEGS